MSASNAVKPHYKVGRLGGGLYAVFLKTSHGQTKTVYINAHKHGCRNFYSIGPNTPLFPTLRDAIFYVLTGEVL